MSDKNIKPYDLWFASVAYEKWRQAGLSDPSTIRISKFLRLEPKDFRRKIGTLRMVDIAGVQNYIDRLYRNTL